MEVEEEEEGTGRPGCQSKVNEDSDGEERECTGRPGCRSKYLAHEDHRDEPCKIREGRRGEFSNIREDRDDGFVQSSKRMTCKRLEKTDGTTNANRSNKFDVLNLTESRLEVEEVKAVDVVQEIVEITVDSGVAKRVWPIRTKGVTRTKAMQAVRLAAANGSLIRVERDARLEFVGDGKKCNTKFLDADVRQTVGLRECRLSKTETSSCSDRANLTSKTRALARGFQ